MAVVLGRPATSAQTTHALAERLAKWRAQIEWTLIALGLLALQVLIPHDKYSDGQVRFDEISALLDHGIIPQQKYSLIGPLFSTPLYLLGRFYSSPGRWISRYNSVLFTLGLFVIYWLLRNKLDRGLLRTFLLILLAASMFPEHVTNYFGETFTAMWVGIGLLAVVFGPAPLGWVLVAVGVANTPASLVALGVTVVRRVFQTKHWRHVLALLGAAGLIGAENWLRRGNPFMSNYESGFTYPVFFGLLSILLSFGKGLVFFVPGLFLPVRRWMLESLDPMMRKLFTAHGLWITFVVGLIVVYAGWHAWQGGWYWGPRFFLIASLPASLALAVRLRRPGISLGADLLTISVLALSTWVAIDGAVYDPNFAANSLKGPCLVNQHMELCDYVLSYSALWHPFVVAQPLTLKNVLFIVYCAVVFIYLALPLLSPIGAGLAAATRSRSQRWVSYYVWRWF
jgi:hypothetical protein